MTSSVHVNNSKKDISIPSKALIQGLDNTTMFAEKEYSINFNEKHKKFCI